ncbi:MAG: hypothetical protein ACI85F_001794 [Bacteroidia bacterium]|jgi:hypothetical protein
MRYSLLFSLMLGSTAIIAQNLYEIPATKAGSYGQYISKPSRNVAPTVNRGGGGNIWSDNFSNPSTWVIDHDATVTTLDWQIGQNIGCSGIAPIDTINSTTKANGYALLDSDEHNQGSVMEDSWITTANSINLGSYPNVMLEFESQYFSWDNEECYVVISTNNTDWPELTPTTDISSMPNVFHVWPGMAQQTEIFNPTLKSIDISAVAGGQSTVWVRFHWTGVWGYSWFVDDVVIRTIEDYDARIENTFFSHNNTGHQYGRIPVNQTNQTKLMGSEVFNLGLEGLSNLSVDASFTGPASFSATGNHASLLPDSTAGLSGTSTTGPLAAGTYSGLYTMESDNDNSSGSQFGNNTMTRNFEVSETRYSKDAIGLNDYILTDWGPISNQSGEGVTPLTYYDVDGTLDVTGIEIALAWYTQVGGQVVVGIFDTTGLSAGATSIIPLTLSNLYTITAADTIAGIAKIWFQTPYNLTANGYYAGAVLTGGPDNKVIAVMDELTFAQPQNSAFVFIPGAQVYSNGTAYAIRLMLDSPPVGIEVEQSNANLTLAPNPNSGVFALRLTDLPEGRLTINVVDVQGKTVFTDSGVSAHRQFNKQFDLSSLVDGVYTVIIRPENGQYRTERFIKH